MKIKINKNNCIFSFTLEIILNLGPGEIEGEDSRSALNSPDNGGVISVRRLIDRRAGEEIDVDHASENSVFGDLNRAVDVVRAVVDRSYVRQIGARREYPPCSPVSNYNGFS